MCRPWSYLSHRSHDLARSLWRSRYVVSSRLRLESGANTPFTAGPIGSPDDGGSATPIGSVVSDGITFNLFSGKNTGTGATVYSFIVGDGSLKNSYSGDLLPFFTYLEKFESGLSGMLLQSIQAGTEAVKGSATFSTSAYTISST